MHNILSILNNECYLRSSNLSEKFLFIDARLHDFIELCYTLITEAHYNWILKNA